MASDLGYGTDVKPLVARVKVLLNRDLISILRAQKLATSGVKATLQARVIQRINHYRDEGMPSELEIMRQAVRNAHLDSPSGLRHHPASPSLSQYSPRGPQNGHGQPNGYVQARNGIPDSIQEKPVLHYRGTSWPTFRMSKHTVATSLKLEQSVLDRLSSNGNYRIMIFGAVSDPALTTYDVVFPHQIELRVNEEEVKSNLRGLKNKPGSTRPADITHWLRRDLSFDNQIKVIYAVTTKPFKITVNLTLIHPVDELLENLKTGKRNISKARVINEMISKSEDVDIVATSTIMSLKCPLSTMRIQTPCRSTICTHNQCFDASSFLQLQQQAPTWSCPICHKTISFEALQVDDYVSEILKSTPINIDQITIQPSGSWSITPDKETAQSLRSSQAFQAIGDDDDLVEIRGNSANPSRNTLPNGGLNAPSPLSTGNKKRRREPVVIDLTLSDSDEEREKRPVKRVNGSYDSNAATFESRPLFPARSGSASSLNLRVPGLPPYHSFNNYN
ncbi:MAG: SUMO ligase siz1 [Vezdaea aestivalis]|nr:MAG: SUMO ligase siz1 [Vezdaea aestivalis]